MAIQTPSTLNLRVRDYPLSGRAVEIAKPTRLTPLADTLTSRATAPSCVMELVQCMLNAYDARESYSAEDLQ